MRKKDDDVAANSQRIVMTYKKLSLELYKAFSDFLKLKFNNNVRAINANEEKEFETVFHLGLIQAKNNLFSGTSTLLHKGKNPRRDVWENLGRIAREFLNCNTYPIIPSYALGNLLNKALGNRDPRVIKDYRKTVLLYCNFNEECIDRCKDSRLGEIDVTFFVSQIPKQYIATSSTSSFPEIPVRKSTETARETSK